jgi:hypothetical protein
MKEMNMKILTKIVLALAFVAIFALMPIQAKADQGNWSTKVTIDQPMQVGNLVLKPGAYILRRMDMTDPDTVEIYSINANKYDGMVMGIPAYRTDDSGKSQLTLQKGNKGAPESLHYWFYLDNSYGLEFPSSQAHSANPTSSHTAG